MGIGLLELVVIAVAALVLLGPEKLPQVLQQIGKFYVQIRRTSNEFKSVFDNMVHKAEEEVRLEELKRLSELVQKSHAAENASIEPSADAKPESPVTQLPRSQNPLEAWDDKPAEAAPAKVIPDEQASPTDKV